MTMNLLLGLIFLPVVAFGQVQLGVEPTKKTTKTSEQGTVTHYVDRVTLGITVVGSGSLEIQTYFVARDTRTHALKYHGAQLAKVTLAGKQTLKSESDPASYSRQKLRTSTARDSRGDMPYGWAVLVFSGDIEAAAKASSPEVLKWVRENPPRKRTYFAP